MSLTEVTGPPGAPWERRLAGSLEVLVVESELLRDNPLGDPHRRPLIVYSSPGVADGSAEDVTGLFWLHGFMGQADRLLNRDSFSPTVIERIDAMFSGGGCPDAVVVIVDAWTSRGGSQYLNSPSTGRYLDYLCDEVVPFVDSRYPTAGEAPRRGLAGKSSGGYGAMVAPMLRPEVFGGLGALAGDALFECCYLPMFPEAARVLRDRFGGSWQRFHQEVRGAEEFDWDLIKPFELYGYACAYSPDPSRPGEALMPFDAATGRLVPEVWEQWLAHDPVRMAGRHREALRNLRRIHLDAGRRDEYFMDLGAQALGRELERIGAPHTLELFDGGHGDTDLRLVHVLRELALALD